MKRQFAHHYQLTEAQLSTLLDTCLIALDTNVLLDLYRYSPSTRSALLRILRKLKPQLWLPHQAGHEFHSSRLRAMKETASRIEAAEKALGTLELELTRIYATAGDTEANAAVAKFSTSFDSLKRYLARLRKATIEPTLTLDADPVWKAVTKLFDGRVGDPYDADRLAELHKAAEKRYQASIPPGFEDASKDGPEKYGDFILWRQMLDKARSAGRPVILVTAEKKKDWWLLDGDRTIMGPRPELRDEMQREAGQPWHMYRSTVFMDVMGQRLDVPASESALEEVRIVGDRDQVMFSRETLLPFAGIFDPKFVSGLNQGYLSGFTRGTYLAGLSSEELRAGINRISSLSTVNWPLVSGLRFGQGILDPNVINPLGSGTFTLFPDRIAARGVVTGAGLTEPDVPVGGDQQRTIAGDDGDGSEQETPRR